MRAASSVWAIPIVIVLVGCAGSPAATPAPVSAALATLPPVSAASTTPPPTSPTVTPALPSSPGVPSPSPIAKPTPIATIWPAAETLPTSGRIAFTIERGETESHGAYIDSAGFHLLPTGGDNTFGNATWAPGDTIIFDSERAGQRHIFRMGIDGQNVMQLTSGDTAQDSATVSPDGTLIAFGDVSPAENRDIGIHLANIDGSNVRDLTPGSGPGVVGEDNAAFSPDGQWVAFGRASDPTTQQNGLFLIRTDGTGVRRLTPDALGADEPHWSLDGKRILFIRGTSDVGIVDVASGKWTLLTDPNDPGLSTDASWSPDGTQIVFRHFTPDVALSIQLLVMNADGTHQATLWVAPTGYGANRPAWGS